MHQHPKEAIFPQWLCRIPPSCSLLRTCQHIDLGASQHSQPTMCQVINMYHWHCRHKMEYRLVHRCSEGFCTRFNPCQGSMKPVIAIFYFLPPTSPADGTTAAADANWPLKMCILSISMRCTSRLSGKGCPRKCCGGRLQNLKLMRNMSWSDFEEAVDEANVREEEAFGVVSSEDEQERLGLEDFSDD